MEPPAFIYTGRLCKRGGLFVYNTGQNCFMFYAGKFTHAPRVCYFYTKIR